MNASLSIIIKAYMLISEVLFNMLGSYSVRLKMEDGKEW